ncbi:MAG: selenocysteine-specific translation elongation factor [Rickettsiales bacterium]|jgi:selenocysteine-specific elongation factor
MIIATAGHIDHGKTVLVKALTGVETDRLPEERARGMSIDLGFAYADLGDGSVSGFIDVPGHERFVRNMLAGVSGVDYALLIVAADDGPMPQTEEHLAILDLLGVDKGCIVLTKIDRVDPDRVEEAKELIQILVDGTTFEGAEIFPVSGITGEGIPALRDHLAAVAATVPDRRGTGNFRLAVDRCFTLAGTGLVVTGTVFSGSAKVGDRLMLTPLGREVRLRGIHAQNHEAENGGAGERCALNITAQGLTRANVRRGDWISAPESHAPTRRLDARIRVLRSEKRPLKHWSPMHLHLAAADVTGRVAILEGREIAPGESGLVQLVLDEPIGALWGDRLILRDQSARRTVAGGTVVDPFSPARGRARPERLETLKALEISDPAKALSALLDQAPAGVELEPFARARNLTPAEAADLWRKAPMNRVGRPEAPIGVAENRWTTLSDEAAAALAAWHKAHPGDPGPTEDQLRRRMPVRVPADLFAALLLGLINGQKIARDGATLRLPAHRAAMSDAETTLWEKVRPMMEEGGLRPPRVREIAEDLNQAPQVIERFLFRAARLGIVHAVAKNRFYPPATMRDMGRIAERLAAKAEDGVFSAADFRDATDIGRNVTIQVLEYFDRSGFTQRVGEGRKIRKPVDEVYGD